jgi:hypothetical protein
MNTTPARFQRRAPWKLRIASELAPLVRHIIAAFIPRELILVLRQARKPRTSFERSNCHSDNRCSQTSPNLSKYRLCVRTPSEKISHERQSICAQLISLNPRQSLVVTSDSRSQSPGTANLPLVKTEHSNISVAKIRNTV